MPDPVAEVDAESVIATSDSDERAVIDIFLGPGDLYFGDRTSRIRTLLGSCVAVTLWHPRARIGGMCHYVVPTRRHLGTPHDLSGHYADEAIDLLLEEIRATATSPQEYQVKMFGGGSQFTDLTMNVATKNVEAGLELLKTHNLSLTSMHFGGTGHRQVVLDVFTGDVWVRHVALNS
jgi:chemotaxis protein CheD